MPTTAHPCIQERGRKVLARVVANKKYGIDQKVWESFEELHQRIAKEIEDEDTNQRGVALNDQQERQREKMRAVQGTFLNILAFKQFGGMSWAGIKTWCENYEKRNFTDGKDD